MTWAVAAGLPQGSRRWVSLVPPAVGSSRRDQTAQFSLIRNAISRPLSSRTTVPCVVH